MPARGHPASRACLRKAQVATGRTGPAAVPGTSPQELRKREDAGSSESGSRGGAGARSPRSILRRREEGKARAAADRAGRARLAASLPHSPALSSGPPPSRVRPRLLSRRPGAWRDLEASLPSQRPPVLGGGKEKRERKGGTARKGRGGPRFAHRLGRRRSPSPASQQQQQPPRPPPPASPALRLGAGKRT